MEVMSWIGRIARRLVQLYASPVDGRAFVAVNERGEDVMSGEICRRNNGKHETRRGGQSVQLPDWVLNKIKK